MRRILASALVVTLVMASCGGGGEDTDTAGATQDNGVGTTVGNGDSKTSDVDVCALLSDEEIAEALGSAPTSFRSTEPIGGLTGCSWDGGRLIVQMKDSTTLVTAPTETDCPSAGVGDESIVCSGNVKFLTNDVRVTVSTIANVELDQLVAISQVLAPKVQGL